jgi:hypothetical protein
MRDKKGLSMWSMKDMDTIGVTLSRRCRINFHYERRKSLATQNTRWFKYDRDLCGLFTHKSVPVIFEPPCTYTRMWTSCLLRIAQNYKSQIITSQISVSSFISQALNCTHSTWLSATLVKVAVVTLVLLDA